MKIECPQCHRIGILEVRGRSNRVVHYEYVDGKRVFTKHLIKGNGNSSMGTMGTELRTEKARSGILFGNVAGPTGIEPATYGLRVRRSSLTEPRARLSLGKETQLGKDIELSVCVSLRNSLGLMSTRKVYRHRGKCVYLVRTDH